MASLILSTAGNAAFGPVGGFIGALVGRAIDNAAVSALTPARVMPSRLAGLKVQTSQEGTPIPIVYGRFRVAGQIIWASKFKESSTKRRVGGKGGQRVVERSYSISFAIGLCEGPIEGLGQVWVNGERFDLATTPHRLYLGTDSQMPDPLIEALEGLTQAPAFRDLAYIVFEDFGLGAYNDRIPQFAFEVMASPKPVPNAPPRLADLARGVCLIPGAGEFAYATTPIRKITGSGEEVGENLHASAHRADFDVALDQLQRDLPQVSSVSLVVAWFGTDLRAGQCQILPKVEDVTKQTSPRAWSVAGLSRSNAARVSLSEGKPAYGGSPDDQSVIEAIVGLKGRGIKVTHNSFVMMDIAAGNALPNPLGGVGQPPYPWRGRITCFPGIGQAGSADGSAAASAQVTAFFGTATASQFSVVNGQVRYSGPNEWSYRRFILHQAALCVAAGGVDSFLIGSELIGLTRVRGARNDFPAVQALIALLGEVRILLGPAVKLSYGADWTEYGAYVPPASNNLYFPLDPLWANPHLDYIGLDWYAPLTDRRNDEPRADFAALQSGIEAGEAFDFYYASEAHRATKTRTPITDGAHQEPWVFRQKDIRSFWSNSHFERVGGVRKATPTPWVAKSKPLALMELGFPAVDKGANRPSVFPDPKSVESGLPPFSTGARDDGEQRVALEATLAYWRDNNPISPLYDGPMLDLARCHIWAWDARPFPQFPGLTELWSDGAYAMLGHWLAGRTGRLSVASILKDLATRAGLPSINIDGVSGFVEGYGVEAPASARALMESLMVVFGLEAQAGAGGLILRDIAPATAQVQIGPDAIVSDESGLRHSFVHNPQDGPQGARFSAYASERDYLPATHSTAATGQDGPAVSLALPLVLDADTRTAIAAHLARAASPDRLNLEIGPALAARLQVGDRFSLAEAGDGDVWRIDRLAGGWQQTLTASRAPDPLRLEPLYAPPQLPPPPIVFSPPVLVVLDACAPFTAPTNPSPLVGCAGEPWPGDIDVWAGQVRVGTLTKPLTLAQLTEDLDAGPVGRRMRTRLVLETRFGAAFPATGQAALLDNGGIADVIEWQSARLIGTNVWEITHWVRGLDGASLGPALPAGTSCVVLDSALTEMSFDPNWLGQPIPWCAIPQNDARIERASEHAFQGRARLPWPPVHVRARRTDAGILLSWVRRARGNGDAWSPANAPLGAVAERYEVTILSAGGDVKRRTITTAPQFLYVAADERTDFGAAQSSLTLEILQIGDDDLRGRPRRLAIDI